MKHIKGSTIFSGGKYRRLALALALILAGSMPFQNCAQNALFENDPDSIVGKLSTLNDQIVSVEMNTPKTFRLDVTGELAPLLISFQDNAHDFEIRTSHGVLKVVDQTSGNLQYTPDPLYRGEDEALAYLVDKYSLGGKIPGKIIFQIGNQINFLKPALALRGSACTACHTNVNANYITDFGYGDALRPLGQPLAIPLLSASNQYYADGHFDGTAAQPGGFKTINFSATSVVTVPKVELTGIHATSTGTSNLKDYLKSRMLLSEHASSRQAAQFIKEAQSIYIGAPNKARLLSVFSVSENPGTITFIKNSQTHSPELQGVSASFSNSALEISGDIVCDGDLLIQGSLRLNAVRVASISGCRIYATGPIFVSNGLESIASDNSSDDHNVQLVSSEAVALGLGSTRDSTATGVCETQSAPNGWYANRVKSAKDSFTYSSFSAHYEIHHDARTRHRQDGRAYANFLMAEAAKFPSLKDATCEAGGRARTMDRLMIVAPRVDTRYNGEFSGAIVAEVSVLSIGSFKFHFDAVFERVAILPMLKDSDYLAITN